MYTVRKNEWLLLSSPITFAYHTATLQATSEAGQMGAHERGETQVLGIPPMYTGKVFDHACKAAGGVVSAASIKRGKGVPLGM